MKIFLFALGLVASMATENNVTATATNLCYRCSGVKGKGNQDCFDESKLNQEKYKCNDGSVCGVARWEATYDVGTVKYIYRDCSNEWDKRGQKNCNDIKIDFLDQKHDACWAICEGHLCNGTREVFGSLVLVAAMTMLL